MKTDLDIISIRTIICF